MASANSISDQINLKTQSSNIGSMEFSPTPLCSVSSNSSTVSTPANDYFNVNNRSASTDAKNPLIFHFSRNAIDTWQSTCMKECKSNSDANIDNIRSEDNSLQPSRVNKRKSTNPKNINLIQQQLSSTTVNSGVEFNSSNGALNHTLTQRTESGSETPLTSESPPPLFANNNNNNNINFESCSKTDLAKLENFDLEKLTKNHSDSDIMALNLMDSSTTKIAEGLFKSLEMKSESSIYPNPEPNSDNSLNVENIKNFLFTMFNHPTFQVMVSKGLFTKLKHLKKFENKHSIWDKVKNDNIRNSNHTSNSSSENLTQSEDSESAGSNDEDAQCINEDSIPSGDTPSSTPLNCFDTQKSQINSRRGSLAGFDDAEVDSTNNGNMGTNPDQFANNVKNDGDFNPGMIRYFSYLDCGRESCKRDCLQLHFHCAECQNLVLTRREEMLRHIKWHKKRQDALTSGFVRFSLSEDCRNENCPHRGRQTHYHCARETCGKILTSTSDMQLHYKRHSRQDNLERNGFRRFCSTEYCGRDSCQFNQEHTTHYHCLRAKCDFVFKNKAEMEKHRTLHSKNDSFSLMGFKKFTKYETCTYSDCRYSRNLNHIHCTREGCNYVVHSSSQIESHNRKHQRRLEMPNITDTGEMPSNQFSNSSINFFNNNSNANIINNSNNNNSSSNAINNNINNNVNSSNWGLNNISTAISSDADAKSFQNSTSTNYPNSTSNNSNINCNVSSKLNSSNNNSNCNINVGANSSNADINMSYFNKMNQDEDDDLGSGVDDAEMEEDEEDEQGSMPHNEFVSSVRRQVGEELEVWERSGSWQQLSRLYSANETCNQSGCPMQMREHYHCTACAMFHKSLDRIREHCRRQHASHRSVAQASFLACVQCDANCEPHYHCKAPGCDFLVTERTDNTGSSSSTRRFEHYVTKHDLEFVGLAPNHHVIGQLDNSNCGNMSNLNSSMMNYSSDFNHSNSANNTNANNSSLFMNNSLSLANSNNSMMNPLMGSRRRGRPPKYPREISVPRISISEEQYTDTFSPAEVTRADFLQLSKNGILAGFKMFSLEFVCNSDAHPLDCPDSNCLHHAVEEHFHCLAPRCHFSSNSLTLVNLHRRDFHQTTRILPGYEFFYHSVDCRRSRCPSRRRFSHFHCTRPNCDYTLKRANTMHQHNRRHGHQNDDNKNISGYSMVTTRGSTNLNIDSKQNLFPLSGRSGESEGKAVIDKVLWNSSMETRTQLNNKNNSLANSIPTNLPQNTSNPIQTLGYNNCNSVNNVTLPLNAPVAASVGNGGSATAAAAAALISAIMTTHPMVAPYMCDTQTGCPHFQHAHYHCCECRRPFVEPQALLLHIQSRHSTDGSLLSFVSNRTDLATLLLSTAIAGPNSHNQSTAASAGNINCEVSHVPSPKRPRTSPINQYSLSQNQSQHSQHQQFENCFIKFSRSQDCHEPDCEHNGEVDTHYHCRFCGYISADSSKATAHMLSKHTSNVNMKTAMI